MAAPSATAYQALLPDGAIAEEEPGRGSTRVKAIRSDMAAAAVTLAVVAAVAVSYEAMGYPHGPSPVATAPPGVVTGNTTELSVSRNGVNYSSACWPFTGDTCNVNSCYSWQHAQCVAYSGMIRLKYCECPAGKCADISGACGDQQNKLVAEGVTFTHAKYPEYSMRVTSSQFIWNANLYVSKRSGGDGAFSLHQVPGGLFHQHRYMINSAGRPGWVVAWKEGADQSDVTPLFETDGAHHRVKPSDSFWVICRPAGKDTVRLGTVWPGAGGGSFIWMYVGRLSSNVYQWSERYWGQPDDRAEWTLSSPLPFEVDQCA